MAINSKIKFVVSSRLLNKNNFVQLGVCSRFDDIESANKRKEEWYESVSDLSKAKPEAIIEVLELPYVTDCKKCDKHLYKEDVGYITRDGIFCFDCAVPDTGGYCDLL